MMLIPRTSPFVALAFMAALFVPVSFAATPCDFALQSLDAQAVSAATPYLDLRAKSWLGQNRCVSCHSTLPYVLARLKQPDWAASPAADVEKYMTDRIANWSTIRPWYNGTRTQQSKATEAILTAVTFRQIDLANGLARTTSRTSAVIDLMMSLQETDGSFQWLNFNLEPFESATSKIWGNSMAMVALGSPSLGDLGRYTTQYEALKTYLRSQWDNAETSPYSRLAIAWANESAKDVITAKELTGFFSKIVSKQKPDGGWSISDISKWRKEGTSEAAAADHSDAFATAYVLFNLKQTQLCHFPKFQKAWTKGVGWLRQNQQANGSWEGLSLNDDSNFNRGLSTDATTGYAMYVLTGN